MVTFIHQIGEKVVKIRANVSCLQVKTTYIALNIDIFLFRKTQRRLRVKLLCALIVVAVVSIGYWWVDSFQLWLSGDNSLFQSQQSSSTRNELSGSIFGVSDKKSGRVSGVFDEKSDKVKAATDASNENSLVFRVRAVFEDSVEFVQGVAIDSFEVAGEFLVEGSARIQGDLIVGEGYTLSADNVIYSLVAGENVTLTGDQDVTISVNAATLTQGLNYFRTFDFGDEIVASGRDDTINFSSGTGISYSVSGDTVTISASGSDLNVSGWTDNGTSVVLGTTSDNVGIGTTTASYKLDVLGDTQITGELNLTDAIRSSGDAGTSGYLLTSSGGGAMTWTDPSTLTTTTYWTNTSNILHPSGELGGVVDLVVGGNSTASAKFQVFGNTGRQVNRITLSTAGNGTAGVENIFSNTSTNFQLNPVIKNSITHTDQTVGGLYTIGLQNDVSNSSSDSSGGNGFYGVYNTLNGVDVFWDLQGLYNNFSNTAVHYGNAAGIYNNFIGIEGDDADIRGLHNDFTTTATYSETYYGIDNSITLSAGDIGYGLYTIDGDSSGGTNYGVYIDIDDANSTNYSLYVANGSGISYFGSNVGIGSTIPSQSLDVVGNININEGSSYMQGGAHVISIAEGTDTHYAVTSAGASAGSGVYRQSAFGYQAGNTGTGQAQSVFGYQAGVSNTGNYQSAFGYQAGYQNSGLNQSAFGVTAGYGNQGIIQSVFGDSAGEFNTGEHQSAFGSIAGYFNSGDHQSAFGYDAGRENGGHYQSAFGYGAGRDNYGDYQSAFGYYAGYLNNGDNVIGIGYFAAYENTADNVVALGYQAGYQNSTANQFIVRQANINAVPLIQGDFSSGNVGIGTSSPVGKLNVNGATTGKALTILNETGGQAIFVASASGTNRFIIQNDGNIGIGTSSPTSRLSIVGSSDIVQLRVHGNATQTNNLVVFEDSGSTSRLSLKGYGNLSIFSTLTPSTERIGIDNNIVGTISSTDNSYFRTQSNIFTKNGAGTLDRLYSTFNFLQVSQGTVTNATGTYNEVAAEFSGVITNLYGTQNVLTDAAYGSSATNAYGSTALLQYDGGGAITNGYGFYVSAPTGVTNMYGLYIEDVGSSNDYAIYAAGTDNSSYFGGNVGIGTTTPSEKLDIDGNGRFRSVASGTYSADLNLTADGTLTTASSDQRLKENITVLQNNSLLAGILQLKPSSFNWKSDGSSDIGLIAQEVVAIFPEVTFVNQVDGYMGINYSRIPTLLIGAIQEQQLQIDTLRLALTQEGLLAQEASATDEAIVVSADETSSESTSFDELYALYEERISVLESRQLDSADAVAITQNLVTILREFKATMKAVFEETVLFLATVTFKEDVIVEGKVRLSADQAGRVVMPAGTSAIHVQFQKEYQGIPIVTATLASETVVQNYYVTEVTTTGFMIKTHSAVVADSLFNWHAFESSQDAVILGVSDEGAESAEIQENIQGESEQNREELSEFSASDSAQSDTDIFSEQQNASSSDTLVN